ncbi:ALBINO3-like protein 1, chloroplastic isoform X1 [Durio zibethinus]|uniref:ALBINO3-like protein 1, chloroplastic isoform X1 n=1 Tax=Durio zibethinus TaxID=66656 RepID=A0A6P5XXT9_DURZI|nr:ALBINO3-like protein 1, chloroplastic isoform X1 [Durio zibethinus]
MLPRVSGLFTRDESLLYTIPDAVVSSSETVTTTTTTTKQNNHRLSGKTNSMETILKFLFLRTGRISNGHAFVAASNKGYSAEIAGGQERIQLETAQLCKLAGINPLAAPSGLSLYWFTNNILSTAQQVWLQKLGEAKDPAEQLNDDIVKEEQGWLQKSLSELNSIRKKAK